MTTRTALRAAALLAVVLVVPACDKFRGFFVPFGTSSVVADLRGSQVVPAVATAATGTASLVLNDSSIEYMVSHTGLGTVTAVAIHAGSAGASGPALFTLGSSPFGSPLIGSLTSANFTPSATVSSFGQARDLIATGEAYILIATTLNPLGEIRGQLGPATIASVKMSGAQVPVAGTGSGTAAVNLNAAQDEMIVTVTFTGLTSATTGAHLHAGAAGAAGPAVFDLATAAFTSPHIVTLTAADFTAGGGLTTFADAVNALLSGTLYVMVETATNPTGEIRGQVGPVQLIATLSEGDVLPGGSGTANTGTANVVLNGAQTAVTVILNHTVLDPTNILIHAESPANNGPQIFDVDAVAGTLISPVEASLTSTHLFAQPVQSIFTFADAVDALIVGRTYIDVASTSFPQGDIRGQIVP